MDRYFVPPELTLLGVERRAATQALLDATAKVRTAFETTLSLVVATPHAAINNTTSALQYELKLFFFLPHARVPFFFFFFFFFY
jgi:hypothetical protein